jgi:hypothetical protein
MAQAATFAVDGTVDTVLVDMDGTLLDRVRQLLLVIWYRSTRAQARLTVAESRATLAPRTQPRSARSIGTVDH